ncbi:hypothetical protein TRIUR3_01767 [Triticum urartu]|uniref:Uncharacterized protein n=1 Tax=Triticum urartu TaxID=4572 RepID=M8A5R9_TRIUA|nr:hypothetical protein TRIUR3_01767 [Triticum urartu]
MPYPSPSSSLAVLGEALLEYHAPPPPPHRSTATGWSLPQPLPLSLLDQGMGDVTGLRKPVVANNVGGGSADQDGGQEKVAARPGCRVQELGAREDGGVRLKVVMTRKDAAEFMARLEKRAAERKARMEELVNGGVMSPCRDAWRPRLATIPEI